MAFSAVPDRIYGGSRHRARRLEMVNVFGGIVEGSFDLTALFRLALNRRDRSVSELDPVPVAIPPGSHYCGRHRPIYLREALDLTGAS
jgi:hypothetical protein